jgi:hypothetical protein
VGGEVIQPVAILQVDHPTAPGERWYRRSVVGAFEHVSVISGNVRLGADGRATVRVPALFASQHRDFRYQLTPLGRATGLHVASTLQGREFVIEADQPRVDVSWQVTGVRSDPAATRAFRADVAKGPRDRGRYALPRLHGQPASAGLTPASVRRRTRSHRRPAVVRKAPERE